MGVITSECEVIQGRCLSQDFVLPRNDGLDGYLTKYE